MKKLINLFIILLTAFTLSSCTLAQDNELYSIDEQTTEEDEYILSRIDFDVMKGYSEWLDTDEYYYVDFACPNATVFDNCIGSDVGSSIEVLKNHLDISYETMNGEELPIVQTITIELVFYAGKSSDIAIYPTFVYENISGDEELHPVSGVLVQKGLAISGTIKRESADGALQILDYTFYFEVLDTLELVTIKQFDKNDNLLVTTEINKDNLLDEIILDSQTEYYFIIENFLDKDLETYQERTYYEVSTLNIYLYKFLNEDGLLEGNRLFIETP